MAATLSDAQLQARADLAIQLARDAGRAAVAFRSGADKTALQVEDKGPQDFVTIADRNTENTIREVLLTAFPEDGFLGEETGTVRDGAGTWVVDPIDGTTNFMRGFRHWGISIAFVTGNRIEIGAIYDATRDKVFHARRGGGAYCEDVPVAVSRLSDPQRAIAILGHSRRTDFGSYLEIVRKLYDCGIDYRRMGAAAIGLVRVADGTADLYYESHLNSWDMLAGALIAAEAGASIFMPPVNVILQGGGSILANAPGLDAALSFIADDLDVRKRPVGV